MDIFINSIYINIFIIVIEICTDKYNIKFLVTKVLQFGSRCATNKKYSDTLTQYISFDLQLIKIFCMKKYEELEFITYNR